MTVLTEHEKTLLQATAHGMTTAEIALRLKVHPQTVKNTLSHIRHKLGAVNTPQAIHIALSEGQIHGPPGCAEPQAPDLKLILANRASRIALALCSWCLGHAEEETFKDKLSNTEYQISGLCQSCQNKTFNPKLKP